MPLYIEKCWLLSDNHHYQTEFSPSISIILHNNFGRLTQKKQRIFDRNRDYCNDGTLSNTPFWNDRHKTNEKFTNWSPVNKSTQIRWSSHTSTNWCVIWFFFEYCCCLAWKVVYGSMESFTKMKSYKYQFSLNCVRINYIPETSFH